MIKTVLSKVKSVFKRLITWIVLLYFYWKLKRGKLMDITALINAVPQDIGTYTYIRIVKVAAGNIQAQIGVAPGILGADLQAIGAGTDLSTLPVEDQEAVTALINIVNAGLNLSTITLTLEDLKPIVGIWGSRLVADFPTGT